MSSSTFIVVLYHASSIRSCVLTYAVTNICFGIILSYYLNPASVEFAEDLPAAGARRQGHRRTTIKSLPRRLFSLHSDSLPFGWVSSFGKINTALRVNCFQKLFMSAFKPMRVMQAQHFYNQLILKV